MIAVTDRGSLTILMICKAKTKSFDWGKDSFTVVKLFGVKFGAKEFGCWMYVVSFQGKFNFPSDVEVSNNARDLMQRFVWKFSIIEVKSDVYG